MKLWIGKRVTISYPWCFEGWNTNDQDQLFDWLEASVPTCGYLVTNLDGRGNYLPEKIDFGFKLQIRCKKDAALVRLFHDVSEPRARE